jgi:hypothetical protein
MSSRQTLSVRFDAYAIHQLRAEVVRLAEENERLRIECANAQDAADFYWQDNMDLQLALSDATGGQPSLTIDGKMVVIDEKHDADSGDSAGSFVVGLLFCP